MVGNLCLTTCEHLRPIVIILESSGRVAYMETHHKTNTYKCLPIANVYYLEPFPTVWDCQGHKVTVLGAISGVTSWQPPLPPCNVSG